MALLGCRADNPDCLLRSGDSVLQVEALPLLRCDVCCAEPGFCPQCKCILCCRAISPRTDDWIQCLQKVSAATGSYCGHCVHLRCAIQCRLAGVVETTGLDVEYLCRRCDRTTDLLPRVSLLVQAVAAAPTKQLAEGNARLAASLVSNTRRAGLKRLETLVRAILVKAENGDDIQAVLKQMCNNDPYNGNTSHDGASGVGDEVHVPPEPAERTNAKAVDKDGALPPAATALPLPQSQDEAASVLSTAKALVAANSVSADSVVRQYQSEIDRALADLKRAQEQEYAAAKTKLVDQMDRILRQYQLLESDRWLSNGSSSETYEAFVERMFEQLSNLRKDREEFEAMLSIGQGFGGASKELLRDSFNWPR